MVVLAGRCKSVGELKNRIGRGSGEDSSLGWVICDLEIKKHWGREGFIPELTSLLKVRLSNLPIFLDIDVYQWCLICV